MERKHIAEEIHFDLKGERKLSFFVCNAKRRQSDVIRPTEAKEETWPDRFRWADKCLYVRFFWAISEKNQRINIYLSQKWIIYFLLSSKNGILLVSENWLDREERNEEKEFDCKNW